MERERVIRAWMARPRRRAHRGCAPTDENAASRDAGGREPIDLPIRATSKAAEKARSSAMDGIPVGMPALSLADKVIARTLASPVAPSVAVPAQTAYTAQALGEVLFALVAAARAGGIDPEQALRARVSSEMADVRAREQRAGREERRGPG